MKNNTSTIELLNLISELEADSIFDKEQFTDKDKKILEYLKELNNIYNITSKVACVTGHRPQKGLPKKYSYDYDTLAYQALKITIKKQLVKDEITDAWTGMAHGVDTIFAYAVIELKEAGYPIKLHCAIPFESHKDVFRGKSLTIYEEILSKADEIVIVSKETKYNPALYQERNEYMVNKSSVVYAVCDKDTIMTTKSGTKNCVKYAKDLKRNIIYINPEDLSIK